MSTNKIEDLNTLEAAAEVFATAIAAFGEKYDLETVGLDEWIESNDDTIFEIAAEFDAE